jgi:hypothetical protein
MVLTASQSTTDFPLPNDLEGYARLEVHRWLEVGGWPRRRA